MSTGSMMIRKKLWDMIVFAAISIGCGGMVMLLESIRTRAMQFRDTKPLIAGECAE